MLKIDRKDRDTIIENASKHFANFLTAMGFDWENDPNMRDTPRRVAKAHYDDLWKGVYSDPPSITAFDNIDRYDGMVFQGNIELNSVCSHHNLPFIGKAHVAYIPGDKVIGLSKLNRVVEWFARRPQVQENLTMQIHNYISEICSGNKGVAVVIEANHLCACVRGVKHDSTMMTSKLSGAFMQDDSARKEFYDFMKNVKKN